MSVCIYAFKFSTEKSMMACFRPSVLTKNENAYQACVWPSKHRLFNVFMPDCMISMPDCMGCVG